jgi:hypothetical protein
MESATFPELREIPRHLGERYRSKEVGRAFELIIQAEFVPS